MQNYFFISFFTTILFLIILRPKAKQFYLIDIPNSRKKHEGYVPLIGGISLFFGVLASQVYLNEFNSISSIILICSTLILLLGIWDDIKNLKPKTKLFIQLILVSSTIYISGIKIESLGQLFASSYLINLGILSFPLTVIAVICLTNAFNMIDGLDGQAIMLTIVAIVGLFSFDLHIIDFSFFIYLLAILSGLIPVFFFNIINNNRFKVFLGDAGSLYLGFTISLAVIYSSQNAKIFSPSFSLWCVAIPLFDFFSVIILRKIDNRSLIMAGRDHIHHLLENYGFSKIFILISISGSGLGMMLIGYYIENNFPLLSFWAFIILFLIYLLIRIYFKPKKNFI